MKTSQNVLTSFTLIIPVTLPGFLDKDLCMQDGRYRYTHMFNADLRIADEVTNIFSKTNLVCTTSSIIYPQ